MTMQQACLWYLVCLFGGAEPDEIGKAAETIHRLSARQWAPLRLYR